MRHNCRWLRSCFAHVPGELSETLGNLTNLTVLNVSGNALTGAPASALHTSSWANSCNHLYAGPPLQETIKLLLPLKKIEELNLGGNKLGGTITPDVGVFSNLKKLILNNMGLDGKSFRTQHTCVVCLLTFSLFPGELPKELGQLTNLTRFDVSNNVQYEKDEDGEDDYDRPIPGTGFTGELYVPT